MAGIKPQNKKEKEQLNVKIDPDVFRDLKAYAAYLDGSDLWYATQELLRAQMAKDAKFQQRLAANRTTPVSAPKPDAVKKGAAA